MNRAWNAAVGYLQLSRKCSKTEKKEKEKKKRGKKGTSWSRGCSTSAGNELIQGEKEGNPQGWVGWGDTGRVGAENGIRVVVSFFSSPLSFHFWSGPGCSRVCAERRGDQFTLLHVRCLPGEAFTPGTFVLAQMWEEGHARVHVHTHTHTEK